METATKRKKVEGEVFTPMHWNGNDRLRFPKSEVKVVSGTLEKRGYGRHGVIEIEGIPGIQFEVRGISCGLPRCVCDAVIVPMK